jgi:hypothetical protein
MPEAMNPPLKWNSDFPAMPASYTIVLWKNSVSAAFYAVFSIEEPRKPTEIAVFLHRRSPGDAI